MNYVNPANGVEVEILKGSTTPADIQPDMVQPAKKLRLAQLFIQFRKTLFTFTLIYASFLLTYVLRYSLFDLDQESITFSPVSFDQYLIIGLFYTVVLYLALRSRNTDRRVIFEKLLAIGNAIVLSTGIVVLILFLLLPGIYYSRVVFVMLVPVTWLTLILHELVAYYLRHRMWRRGIGVRRLLVVGATDLGSKLMQIAAERAHLGYRVVGFVDDELRYSDWVMPARYGNNVKRTNPEIPYLGNTSQLSHLVKECEVDEVMVVLPMEHPQLMTNVIRQCQLLQIPFTLAPSLGGVKTSLMGVREIGGIPLIETNRATAPSIAYSLKRGLDILCALAALLLGAIPMLLIALAIKLDSRGPVIFRQTRIGKNGKPFMFYKFRSMYTDADARLAEIQQLNETQGATFKMKKDPRVTRVGRFIRRTSLDELPQLFNILFGQMTLVGPRPGLPREVVLYEPWQYRRLEVTPGLTGLWQVNGRSSVSFEEMVKLDIYYLEHWSLALDLKILIKTIKTVVKGEGAY